MIKQLHLACMAMLWTSISFAQSHDHHHWCGTDAHYKAEAEKHPDAYQKAEASLDETIAQYSEASFKKDDGRTYYIPVVFHYFHNETSPERFFGAEQAAGVLKRLNEDFSATNPDVDKIQDYYQDLRGNPNIQFLLAEKDERGDEHSGINYVKTIKTKASERTTDNQIKSLSSWNRDMYLNFWIVESLSEEGVLAFATLPEFAASGQVRRAEDGIIGIESLFRTTLGIPFERHALSHEVGHWLGLRHPFQGDEGDEDGCSLRPCKFGGDRICDIAQVDRARNDECIAGVTTCPTDDAYPNRPDNITNIMDYRSCPQMFSKGQVVRMRGVLASTRSTVVSWANLQATGIGDRVKEQELVKTTVYPNPFSQQVAFDIDLKKEVSTTLAIKDILGKTIYEQPVHLFEGMNHVELTASQMGLPTSGVYLLEIKLEESTVVKRIQYTSSL